MKNGIYSLFVVLCVLLGCGRVEGQISGPTSVCTGSSITLSDTATGGTWSSSNSGIATVGPGTGVVTGVAAGTVVISYYLSGSYVTDVVTVAETPNISLGANPIVCAGVDSALLTYSGTTGSPTYSLAWSDSASSAGFTGTTAIITTVAGNGIWGEGGDGGSATAAVLEVPCGLVIDGFGNLYIADENASVVRKVNPSGAITTVAGNLTLGYSGYSGDGSAATAAELFYPQGLAIDGAGNLYIADQGNCVIRKVNTSGIITTIAGNYAFRNTYTGDGGPATSAGLSYPSSIAFDGSGNLYIADAFNNVIRKVNTSGIISTVAGNNSIGNSFSGDGGPATAAGLWLSYEGLDLYQGMIAIDGPGNIYIADGNNNVIRKVNTSGIISTIAGNYSLGYGIYSGDGGPATMAGLNRPSSVVIDGSGNLFISDYGNYVIREVTTSGTITTIAGNGSSGYTGDGGSALSASLGSIPAQVVDASGNLYLADASNHVIRRLNKNPLPTSPITLTVPPTAHPGTYSGYITVYNGPCNNSYPISVTVAPSPNPYPGMVCSGSSINLNEGFTGGTWSSSNTSVATVGTTGLVTGVNPGTASISYNTSASCAVTVAVNETPTISLGINPIVCAGDTTANLTYSGTTGSPTFSLSWSDTAQAAGFAGTPAIITTVAGSSHPGDGGPATAVAISASCIAVDTAGNFYFATLNTVRKVDTAGIISTVAGNGEGGYSGDGGPAIAATLNGPAGIAFDASGNLYIIDAVNYVIRKVNTSGIITTVAGNYSIGRRYSGDGGPATAAGLEAPTAIAVDGLGNLYIVDGNRVRKVNTSGIITTVAGDGSWSYSGDGGPATAAGLYYPAGVAVDGLGNLYIADQSNDVIRKVNTSGIITTVAGNHAIGLFSYSGDGGPATAAGLSNPSGVSVDGLGNLYIVDQYNSVIRKVNTSGIITTVAGDGSWSYSGDGGPATAAGLTAYGVAVDGLGNLYIADPDNNVIRKVNTSGIITTVAGNHASYSDDGDGGPATASGLGAANDVAIDNNGNLYIASSVIRKVSTSGIISTVAGSLSLVGTYSGDGGPATAAGLSFPSSVAVDASGNLYFADNNVIRKVNTAGIITTVAGNHSAGWGYSGDGGPAIEAQINSPGGIAIDASGKLYFEDCGNNVIRKVDTSGIIYTIAGNHTPGYGGDGGPATSAAINFLIAASPFSSNIVFDNSGNLYIADIGNNVVRKVNTAGIISTVAGNHSTFGSYGDGGQATAAGLEYPIGLAFDGVGNLYITESGSGASGGVIREVTANGIISTVAGNNTLGYGYSGDGGSATAARLNGPADMSIDASGNLYFADQGNNVIRKVSSITTLPTSPIPLSIPPTAPNGTYNGNITVYNGLCSTEYPISVTLDPSRGVITGPIPILCSGSSISLTDTASGGLWTSSNTSIATVSGGVVTGVSAGTATISYTVTSACGTRSASDVFTVNETPTISLGTNPTVCAGDTTASLAYSSATGSPTYSLSWSDTAQAVGFAGTPAIISTVAGDNALGFGVYSGDGGAATAAGLYNPISVAVDGYGNLYIADNTNNVIRKVTPSGIITSVAGNGGRGYSGDGSPATSAELNDPLGVAVDGSGNLYIADANNNVIRKVNTSGIITTVAGNGSISYSGDGSSATSTGLGVPSGVAIDGLGNIYLAVLSPGVVRKVSASGIISTIAGNSSFSGTYIGDGGPATAAGLSFPGGVTGPVGLAIDGSGNLYITDVLNYVIRKVDATGIITTVAGNGSYGYGGDGGPATAAELGAPNGVAIDGSGNLYIAAGVVVRKVSPLGIINTIAGDALLYGSYSGDGGPATAAGFTAYGGVALDGSGNLYIADADNNVIRKVSTITTLPTSSIPLSIPDTAGAGTYYGNITVYNGNCSNTYPISVTISSHAPDSSIITGPASVCAGSNITDSDTVTSGGAWNSSNASVAMVNSSGVVTGVAAGTATISYTATNGCGSAVASKTVTVNPLPDPGTISGYTSLCTGSYIELSESVSGGSWSSSNSGVATVSSSGIVGGVTVGVVVISYTTTNGCGPSFTTFTVTVNPTPIIESISGGSSVCAGATLSLTDTGSGFWYSANMAIATVGTTGAVTGVAAGTTLISYGLSSSCGELFTSHLVTVSPLPNAGVISGASGLRVGTSITLSDGASGGSWSSSNTSIVSVGSTGIVTGVGAGTASISYLVTNSCGTAVAVFPLTDSGSVSAGTITGPSSVCAGASASLADTTSEGSWSSSNLYIATIGSLSGIVSGVAAGSAVISYTVYSGVVSATATFTVVVDPQPSSISGTASFCKSATSTLANTLAGGTWSSGNTYVATVGSTGVVTGVNSGTASISYAMSTGCYSSITVTVNTVPAIAAIAGPSSMCTGSTGLMTDTTPGGYWFSSNESVAMIDDTGLVTSESTGFTEIAYAVDNACGINVVFAFVSVTSGASAISGASGVCAGDSILLTDATSGGLWNSGATFIATVGSTSGEVTGVAPGTAVITYLLGTGCSATAVVTVNTVPYVSGITGSASVCMGSSSTLSESTTGGTWSSSNTGVANVGTSGIVEGVAAGISIISYAESNCCGTTIVTHSMAVSPLPSAGTITGASSFCAGGAVTLSDTTGGGTWSASSTEIATVSGGVVTGAVAGTVTISYTFMNICGTTSATKIITIDPQPSPISGTTSLCAGSTTTLTDAGSGMWFSNNTTVATIGSSSGIASAVAAGSTVITYELGTGCFTTTTITVNPLPTAISGPTSLCAGSTTTLTDAGSGMWFSSNASVATIGSSSGIVSAVAAGSTVITYGLGTGCFTTTIITVNPQPSAISGTTSLCAGSTTNLTDAGSGMWTSSNASVATIGSVSGIVSGVAEGSAIITYELGTGCFTNTTITVNPQPSAISGTTSLCAGSITTLTDADSGVWFSSNTSVANIGSTSGIVSGVTAGSTIITYDLGTGCFTTTTVTVNPQPSTISGTTSLCAGSTTNLTDAGSGMWTSSNTDVATIGSVSGIVSGVAAGSAIITYELGTGCFTNTTITVNPQPSAISGTTSLCAGSITTLTDAGSGMWFSSNASVATIGSSSGIVSAVAAGSTVITYGLGTGCFTTTIITVNPQPSAISGTTSLCAGSTTNLTDAGSGMWTSSNASVATIGSVSGIVSGVAEGSAIITYELGTGCFTNTTITVNPQPSAISGTTSLCAGSITTLTDADSGVWFSSNASVATIGSSSGIVSGIAAGNIVITYSLSTGCFTFIAVTVNPLPFAGPIIGAGSVCPGSTITLSDTTSGGSWSSSNTSASVSGGTVTGVTAGTVTISYTITNSCGTYVAIHIVSISSSTNAGTIGGASLLSVGATITVTDTVGGGTWASGNTGVATVGSLSGVVTGVSAGTVLISYTISGTCGTAVATDVISVSPQAISGVMSLCAGSTTALADTVTGGVWTSGNTSVATIGSLSGILTGVSGGTVMITYTASGVGITSVVTVNPTPATIAGPTSICTGTTVALTDATPGGTWSSGSTGIATIGTTGWIMGVSSGTAIISYLLPTGCETMKLIAVSTSPASIAGSSGQCTGQSGIFTDLTGGGAWFSSNSAVISIGSGTGIAAGVSGGAAIITYSVASGCVSILAVTVNASPDAISGAAGLCTGITTSFTDVTSGGTWSSANSSVASAGSGLVSAVSSGTTTISYTLTSGCAATKNVTVNVSPAPVSGPAVQCTGIATQFTDTSSGGYWTSSNTSAATAGSGTGIVTGVTSGMAAITYTLGSGCIATTAITVNTTPNAITGPGLFCTGIAATLSDGTPSGVWSSVNTGVATIAAGTVTGVAAGTTVISYTLASGCAVTKAATVTASPSSIACPVIQCTGQSTLATDSSSGGSWTSSNSSAATVNGSTGVITGVAAGVATITYSAVSGCYTIRQVTVNTTPNSISGAAGLCASLSTSFTDATPGGAWSSASPSIATVGSSGIVHGVTAGTATISYSVSPGCASTKMIAITASPAPITGPFVQCTSTSTQMTDASSGGLWTSSNTSSASVGSATGIVTGVTGGSISTISYSLSGCYSTRTVSVYTSPNVVSGVSSLCSGTASTFTDATGSGAWSSSSTSVATIASASGMVTAVSAGTTIISYSVVSGCAASKLLSVVSSPSPISGPSVQCAGLSTQFSDGTPGGTWSSSNTSAANVGTSGIVTGVTASSVATITYSLSGCYTTQSVNVFASPYAVVITTPNLCAGTGSAVSDATTGGSWISSNNSVATVSGSTVGMLMGVSAGTAMVSYALSSGCASFRTVTINAAPTAIAGPSEQCTGESTLLTNGTADGIWTSSNTSAATVGSLSGTVTGVTVGVANITYTVSGCIGVTSVTVNTSPYAISGAGSTLCVGYSTTCADATSAGFWSSSNSSVASVGTAGVVSGLTAGTTIISYMVASGCASIRPLNVIVSPAPVSGPGLQCTGDSTLFSDATVGGIWISGNTSAVTIGSVSGVATGVTAGVASITFSVSGCISTMSVSVAAAPYAVSGISSMCTGGSATFADASSGGVWTSTNSSVVMVGSSTAMASGVGAGTATISYTLSSGCAASKTVTLNLTPTAVSGPPDICTGIGYLYSDGTGGGTWISSNIYAATIGSASGNAIGVAVGVSNISYVMSTGCYSLLTVTVNASPYAISGSGTVANGYSTTFTDASSGGSWTSSNTSMANVGSASGLVSGVALGSAIISYTLPSGCYSDREVTVVPPGGRNTAAGALAFCAGQSINLTQPGAQGMFATSDPTIAIVSEKGLVTGIAAGEATISYIDGHGALLMSTQVIVNQLPDAIILRANPGNTINEGQVVTFSAPIEDGSIAEYRWLINGTAIPGATLSSFTTGGLADSDIVGCMVSMPQCSAQVMGTTVMSVITNNGFNGLPGIMNVRIMPNPNKGSFSVKGSLGVVTDQDVNLQITDVLGQTIYENRTMSIKGFLNEFIRLNNALPNGMYILNVRTEHASTEYHFVVEQ